ncbi:TPA: hypothetical protein ACGO0I_000624 [Streptococcus suis]
MNKRIKKKYKPIIELWDCMDWFGFRLNGHKARLDSLDSRLDNLKDIESTNIQIINRNISLSHFRFVRN